MVTLKGKIVGDAIYLSNGVKLYFSIECKVTGYYFVLCKKNFQGSYDPFRVLRITSTNTIEE